MLTNEDEHDIMFRHSRVEDKLPSLESSKRTLKIKQRETKETLEIFLSVKENFATVKFGLRKKFEKRYARVSDNERESSEKGLDILGCMNTIF